MVYRIRYGVSARKYAEILVFFEKKDLISEEVNAKDEKKK
jgi:hypothetical protein